MNKKELLNYLFDCEKKETCGQWAYKGDTDNLDWSDIEEYGGSYGIREEDCIYIHPHKNAL